MRDAREDRRVLALQRRIASEIGALQLGARLRTPCAGVEWVIFLHRPSGDIEDFEYTPYNGAFYDDERGAAFEGERGVEKALRAGETALAELVTSIARSRRYDQSEVRMWATPTPTPPAVPREHKCFVCEGALSRGGPWSFFQRAGRRNRVRAHVACFERVKIAHEGTYVIPAQSARRGG